MKPEGFFFYGANTMVEIYLILFSYLMVGTIILNAIIRDWGDTNFIDLSLNIGVWLLSPLTLPLILGSYVWRNY